MLRRFAWIDWSLQLYPETGTKVDEKVGLESTAAKPLIWPLDTEQSRRTQLEGPKLPSLSALLAEGTWPRPDSLISDPVRLSCFTSAPVRLSFLTSEPVRLLFLMSVPVRLLFLTSLDFTLLFLI